MVLLRIGFDAGCQQREQLAREDPCQQQQDHLRGQQQREDLTGEMLRLRGAFRLENARIGRHIGGVERALAEDGAEMVRQAESDVESIRQPARAEHGAEHHVAQETREPRQEREAADREKMLVHELFLTRECETVQSPLGCGGRPGAG